MAAQTQYHFSTGKIRVGAVGAALTDAENLIGIIKNVTFENKTQKKELMAPPSESMYPVAVAFFGGSVSLKFESDTIERALFERIVGATKASAGGVDTYTIGKTSKPSFCKVEFEGEDVDGKAMLIRLFKAVSNQLPLAFKMDDFVAMNVEFEAYPSAADTDKVCDIELDQ